MLARRRYTVLAMDSERRIGLPHGAPFPIHEDPTAALLAAHVPATATRDPTVAHVLATCAAYAYSDTATVATIAARLGFAANACVRLAQTVDAMLVFSTAYLIQSRCGRLAILCYRGTPPASLGSWAGDADVGAERMRLASGDDVRVHAGYHRNVRATRFRVLEELQHALSGRSLADPAQAVEHPLEALYVTGHSLGGAMALLFALSLGAPGAEHAIAERLRAVYTFGQPMAIGGPVPRAVEALGHRLFRHVIVRDVVPALPPAAWGRFAHFGHEFRHIDGTWRRSEAPVAQLASARELAKSLLGFVASEKRRAALRYDFAAHGPHRYLAALRPAGRLTEFGDDAAP